MVSAAVDKAEKARSEARVDATTGSRGSGLLRGSLFPVGTAFLGVETRNYVHSTYCSRTSISKAWWSNVVRSTPICSAAQRLTGRFPIGYGAC